MHVFLNGELVPEDKALISAFDRGFLYGDGLFETIRVHSGNPFRWPQHMERLRRGADFLKIRMPFKPDALRTRVAELVQKNKMTEGILRVNLSRGVGPRGYSPKDADKPTMVMSLHQAPTVDPANPPRWRLVTSIHRVNANDPLTGHKTCNKLTNVLAKAEAEAEGADEALLLNSKGEVAETATGNIFWVENHVVNTTPLTNGILPGVTRSIVLELCEKQGIPTREESVIPEELMQAEGVFLSLSSMGIVEIFYFENHGLSRSPVVEALRNAYREALEKETTQPE